MRMIARLTMIASGVRRTSFAILAASALGAVAANAETATDLSSNGQLQTRRLGVEVERAEALRAIKRLEYARSQYMQYGLWDEAAAIYAEDAELLVDNKQVARGRPALRRIIMNNFGRGDIGPQPGVLHTELVLSPVVTLAADGESGKARWHAISMTGRFGDEANWSGGILENDYVKKDGVWKISRRNYYPQFAGSYETGWRSLTPHLPIVPYHYIPSQAGRPVPEIPGGVLEQKAGLETVNAQTMAGLERRIAAMNDEDEVRNLQNAYGYYIDRKMWDDVVDLFADDAALEIAGLGVYEGGESLRRALQRDGPAGLKYGQVNDKLQLHTLVAISPGGRTARARGLELGMLTPKLGEAFWTLATFDNDYVKEDGVWKIARMRIFPVMKIDYYQGWAKSAIVDPPPPAAFAPDGPALSQARDANGAVVIPAFRFDNPATGAPVRYPRGAGLAKIPGPAMTETPPRAATDNGAATAARLADARRNLNRSIAYDAVENIAGALGDYLDDFQWSAFADMMAKNGWRPQGDGFYIGRDHIYRAVVQSHSAPPSPASPRDTIRVHLRTQPVIDVAPDARSAKIRNRMLLYTISSKSPGYFASGMYPNDSAVVEDGVWKMFVGGSIDEKYFNSTGWKEGWARAEPSNKTVRAPRNANTRSLGGRMGNPISFPPDTPFSDMPIRKAGFGRGSPTWPDIKPMWFHYRNPVSGRRPAHYCPDLTTCESSLERESSASEQ